MDHTLVHFELPADDVEALAKFYTDLFGWKIEKTPGPMEYWMIHTTPGSECAEGGMMKRQVPQQGPLMYFQVESIDDYVAKVKSLGGQVVMDKQPVPGMGYFAVAIDPEHNPFAMWEDDQAAK